MDDASRHTQACFVPVRLATCLSMVGMPNMEDYHTFPLVLHQQRPLTALCAPLAFLALHYSMPMLRLHVALSAGRKPMETCAHTDSISPMHSSSTTHKPCSKLQPPMFFCSVLHVFVVNIPPAAHPAIGFATV